MRSFVQTLIVLHCIPVWSKEPVRVIARQLKIKVVRFADKNRHQVFIEPEGLYTNEMYIGGMSSSLPEDVQEEMYHSVPDWNMQKS